MIKSVQIIGGTTRSIFPEVEKMLEGNSDYQRAVEYVAEHKRMNSYRSVMDFLFCEIHPKWIRSCRRFYAGKGPSLRYQITLAQQEKCNARLIVALDVARTLFREQRCKSWQQFRNEVEKAFKPAV